jgi:hypothetical protein
VESAYEAKEQRFLLFRRPASNTVRFFQLRNHRNVPQEQLGKEGYFDADYLSRALARLRSNEYAATIKARRNKPELRILRTLATGLDRVCAREWVRDGAEELE